MRRTAPGAYWSWRVRVNLTVIAALNEQTSFPSPSPEEPAIGARDRLRSREIGSWKAHASRSMHLDVLSVKRGPSASAWERRQVHNPRATGSAHPRPRGRSASLPSPLRRRTANDADSTRRTLPRPKPPLPWRAPSSAFLHGPSCFPQLTPNNRSLFSSRQLINPVTSSLPFHPDRSNRADHDRQFKPLPPNEPTVGGLHAF